MLDFKQIGTIAGVKVYIHNTLIHMLAIIILLSFCFQPENPILLPLLFVSTWVIVFLHEWGHIIAARYFGEMCSQLLMTPIGGAAILSGAGKKPIATIVIALAGPMVNLLLNLILIPLFLLFTDNEFIVNLTALNLLIMGFNLIPAYPMDGGRVLQGLLWLWMDRHTATIWAVRSGKALAVLMGAFALSISHIMMFIVAIFIYVAASRDIESAKNSK